MLKSITNSLKWLHQNLFSGYLNTLITLIILYSCYQLLPPLFNWLFWDAVWIAETRTACDADGAGACWAFIANRFEQFMYGFYPETEYWRPNIAGLLLIALVIPFFIARFNYKYLLAAFTLMIYPFIAYVLLHGGYGGLTIVETSKWGGLMLTLIIAIIGMLVSLPLGIILALGRQSEMPVVKSFCIVFIEFWRGIPLITVLFMSSVMLPLFFPEGTEFGKLLRAMIGIILFLLSDQLR